MSLLISLHISLQAKPPSAWWWDELQCYNIIQYVLIVKISWRACEDCEVPELGHVTPGTCSGQLPTVQCPLHHHQVTRPQAASRELLCTQTRSSAHQKSLLLLEAWLAVTVPCCRLCIVTCRVAAGTRGAWGQPSHGFHSV